MLLKSVVFTLMLFEAKVAVNAAAYIIPAQEKPEEFECYEGCYDGNLKLVIPYNESYSPQDGTSCIQYSCNNDDSISGYSCGVIGFPDTCERVPGDKYLPYPDCCDTVRCNAVDPVVDPIEPEPVENSEEPGNPSAPEPKELAPETNPNSPPAEAASPIEPEDPKPQPEPQPGPLPPAKTTLPIKLRPVRPPICPVYVAGGPNKMPTRCRPPINPKQPVYSIQPVPAATE